MDITYRHIGPTTKFNGQGLRRTYTELAQSVLQSPVPSETEAPSEVVALVGASTAITYIAVASDNTLNL